MSELDVPPSWTEFINAIQELTNDKAPGLNGAPLNAFKSMSEDNLRHHFGFITEFWEDKVDFKEWNKGQVATVPKSGDLFDPNKWRGINLMDIGAKVFSSLICKLLFKIINKTELNINLGPHQVLDVRMAPSQLRHYSTCDTTNTYRVTLHLSTS